MKINSTTVAIRMQTMHLQRKQNIVKCRVEWPRPSLCSGPRNTGVYTHDTDDTAHTGDREVHLGFNSELFFKSPSNVSHSLANFESSTRL